MPVTKPLLICVVQPMGASTATGFKVSRELDELIAWADTYQHDNNTPSGETNKASEESENKSPIYEDFSSLMDRIVDSSYHQSETFLVLRHLSFGLPAATIQKDLVNDRLAMRDVVHSTENAKIYETNDTDRTFIYSLLDRLDKLDKGLDYLPSAMLLSTVAIFDGLTSDIVRSMFRVKSDRLKSSEKKISLSEILEAKSLDEVISNAITDEVYAFSRNSHDEQVKFIEDSFSINIRQHWKRWPDFIEVFERRNLVAHGEAKFTSRYVGICSKQGHKGSKSLLGEKIVVNYSYLKQSLEILIEFLILTNFSLWRKHMPGQAADAFARMNEVTYELIKNGQPIIARNISEYVLSLKTKDLKESNRLMLVVNLASASRHCNNDEHAFKVLDAEDWSATSDLFKVCVAALREDCAEIEKLLPLVRSSKSLSADDVRTWPVFDFVKNQDSFERIFKDVFDEELNLRSAIPATVSVSKPDSDDRGDKAADPLDISKRLH